MKKGRFSPLGFYTRKVCLNLLSACVLPVVVWGQTPCMVDAGPDVAGCNQSTVQLSATPGFDSYVWSPATGLSDPYVANPTVTIMGTQTYTVTVFTDSGPAVNLLTNGDFSQGDVGFTSAYTSMNLYSPCYYYVGPDYYDTNLGYTDHSVGSDNFFMSVDCCDQPSVLWEQTVSIQPGTQYRFSFWATPAAVTQPTFDVFFIGNVTGEESQGQTPGAIYSGVNSWDEYAYPSWNSGSNTSVTIRLLTLGQQVIGSDFALDDFAFVTHTCSSSDVVQVSLELVPPPLMPEKSSVCRYDALHPLQAEGQNILWYDLPGTAGHVQAPVPATDAVGTTLYYASQTINGCESELASTLVEVIGAPSVDLGEPFNLCVGDVRKLGVEEVTDGQYVWMDGKQGALREISSADLGVAVYTLTVNNSCGSSVDSVAVTWEECLCYMYWPNAFSPNADLYNNTFKPAYDCRIEEFDLRIFNRWGELIFESHNPDEGWAGQRNGQPAEQGLYVVQVNYSALSGTKKIHKSATDKLTLLR